MISRESDNILENNFISNTLNDLKFPVEFIIFDYDSTIARLPIDWLSARVKVKAFLKEEFSDLDLSGELRVDEMEYKALQSFPESQDLIFSFRRQLESNVVSADPLEETVRFLNSGHGATFLVLSNNLRETVEKGLRQLGISDVFKLYLGVDDTLAPKPSTRGMEIFCQKYSRLVGRTVFVGDSEQTDGEFCRRTRIPFINVRNKTFQLNHER